MSDVVRVRKEMQVWLQKVRDAETTVSRSKTHLRKGGRVIRKEMRRIIKAEASKAERKSTDKKHANITHYYKRGQRKKGLPAQIIASFVKGNLFRSIKVLTFKKSWDIFVGPKFGGSIKPGSIYATEGNVDAYYARFVNDGTKHMRGIDFINRSKIAKEKEAKEKVITSIKHHLGVEARKKGLK